MKYWMNMFLIVCFPNLSLELREQALNLLRQIQNPLVDELTKLSAIDTLRDILNPPQKG